MPGLSSTTLAASLMSRLSGLSPVYLPECRILILGSFPSPASLAARQYYGHPKNQFWSLLAAAIHEPLPELDYSERIERVLAHQIGIWDVYQSCIRPGALDADIRAGTINDFSAFFMRLPHLQRLCFNGQTAGKCAPQLLSLAASILQRSLEHGSRAIPAIYGGVKRDKLIPGAEGSPGLYRGIPGRKKGVTQIRILPSSSPAYTLSFARKLERWQEALTISA